MRLPAWRKHSHCCPYWAARPTKAQLPHGIISRKGAPCGQIPCIQRFLQKTHSCTLPACKAAASAQYPYSIYSIYIYNIYIIYILYIIFIYILYFIYAYNVLQFSAVPMIHSHSWTLTDLTETTQAGRFKAAAGLFSEAGHPCYTLVHQYWIYLDRFILGLPCIHIYLCLSIFIHAGVFSYLEVGALFAILHPQHPSKLTIHILNQNSISRYFRVRVQMTCLFSHVCLSPSLERYQTSP